MIINKQEIIKEYVDLQRKVGTPSMYGKTYESECQKLPEWQADKHTLEVLRKTLSYQHTDMVVMNTNTEETHMSKEKKEKLPVSSEVAELTEALRQLKTKYTALLAEYKQITETRSVNKAAKKKLRGVRKTLKTCLKKAKAGKELTATEKETLQTFKHEML